MPKLNTIKDVKGKFCDGYRYYKHKSGKFKTWWRCECFRYGCEGWGFERDEKFILTRNHNHTPDPILLQIENELN